MIYLDNAATTPMDPRVRESMLPFFGERFGNPSSMHYAGRFARSAVENARKDIASLIVAQPEEIIFTASGTESANLAINGIVYSGKMENCHIITSAIEHPAVLEPCRELLRRGFTVTFLPVGKDGIIEPELLENAMRPDTKFVSLMSANNVTGVLQPVNELCKIAHNHGAIFHTDAVQAAGKIPINVSASGVDLMTVSAHKLYGPQGMGALFVRKGVTLKPLIHGGGQERGLRPATENVAGIAGFGCAAALAHKEMTQNAVHLVGLRERIINTLSQRIKNIYFIGDRYRRLPGHICLGLTGQEGQAITLLLALDRQGFALSSGSACSSHNTGEPSHVLRAMGYDPVTALGPVRITLGRFTTSDEVDRFIAAFIKAVEALKPATLR